MCGEGSFLASQCLAFCKALASQGQAFNFSLKIGSNFSFCLDSGQQGCQSCETRCYKEQDEPLCKEAAKAHCPPPYLLRLYLPCFPVPYQSFLTL